jgi:BolA family transcriptional regulator, general stress-responsive regulator
MDIHAIEHTLRDHFQPSHLTLNDTSAQHQGHAGVAHLSPTTDTPTHLSVTIVSHAFKNLSRMQRHRAIHKSLKPALDTHLHALSIQAFAPNDPNAPA